MSDASETRQEGDDAEQTASTDPSGDIVATVTDVGVSFGDVTVFDGVSFEVTRGAVTALVGPNGSGKSTLVHVVAGLLPATTGSVSVVAGGSRPVGFCPQEPTFRAGFTVEETLSFYAELLDSSVSVRETLELVGLDGVADRRVSALSGGMKRLLGLGQAVLGDPPLLVLDEPASGLDPAMRAHIFDTVGAIADRGTAVLLATHHLVGAESADRLLVIDRGGIVASGTPTSVMDETGTDSLEAAFRDLVGDELTVRSGTEGARSGVEGTR
ncbi:ABC transporter ATP-binding protein [Haloarchaeobius sp. DT45]|uniref:ABC transporter ATP-binding protein n=1 Tax=Haloarchaeobius sp. DT45 TaxID=3446116 RepID=UPI003F6B89FC